MAGLYTAMILQSLGINYQIVDADTQERVGGRLFTYHFPGDDPDPGDYYVSNIHIHPHRALTFL
jgi:monoamine oxidase